MLLAVAQPWALDTRSVWESSRKSFSHGPACESYLPQPHRAQPPRPFPRGTSLPQPAWEGTSISILPAEALLLSDVCPQTQDPANALPLIITKVADSYHWGSAWIPR